MTNKYLQFDIENAEVIEDENSDSQFATAKIRAFSSDKNLHNLVCSEDILQQTASTIYNKPILYTIDKSLQDFYTHVEPDKSLICGFVVPDSAEFTRLDDGRLSLNVFAKIWKKYSPKVIEFFKRDKDFKRVSVEMEVYEFGDRPDGLKDMLSFAYAGICILGDYVREASPGANMQMVSFSEEKKLYDEAYIAEFASKYDELDFSISLDVKKNAQEGLDLYKKFRRGGTSVSLAVARHLINNEKASPEKIHHIEKHFTLHADSDFSDKTGKEFIKWQLYGGNAGFSWSKKLVESMGKIDKRKMSYFEQEGENIMPYSKIGEINPALKGIEPPISLAQANAIAKQADAVGTTDKVNGWAVAISSFKKTHKVEDGKWVEKNKEEKMTEEEKKAEEAKMAEDAKKAEEAKMAEDAKKAEEAKIAEDAKKVEESKKAEEEKNKGKFSFAKFGNLVSYMDDEPDADDEETKMCKMASEELKKGDEADFATVVGGMYAKMCKMMAKMAKMADEKKAEDAEMSALKEFKMGVDKQQKQFAIDQTLQEIDEKVIIPDDARKEMLADAEKYSLAEIESWKNACRAKGFTFALKGKKSKEIETIIYALPFSNLPKPENNGSVWPAKKS